MNGDIQDNKKQPFKGYLGVLALTGQVKDVKQKLKRYTLSRTAKLPVGRCRLHGGASTGPGLGRFKRLEFLKLNMDALQNQKEQKLKLEQSKDRIRRELKELNMVH